MSIYKRYLPWETEGYYWDTNPFTWDDYAILVTVSGGGGADTGDIVKNIKKLPEKEKRKLIKVVAKVKGKEYAEKKFKTDKEIKVLADDIKVILDEIIYVRIK